MMKRWTAILMILVLAVGGMVGCKKEESKKTATTAQVVEEALEQESASDLITPSQDDNDKGSSNNQSSVNQTSGNNTAGTTSGTDTGKSDTGTDTTKSDTDTSKSNTDTDTSKSDTKPSEEDEEDEDGVEYEAGNKIKILDYNLRCANDEGGNSIKERSVRFREVMKKYTPDICGFQEIVPEWVTYLNADYPDYGKHIEYRSANSKEGTMVMWNTATMEAVEYGHFWLSPTPDVMSSGDAAWGQSGFYRIVAWAKVKVRATGSIFIYFSTHQNNAGTHPENSAKTILSYAKKFGVGTKFGGFCMGDYNVRPWSNGYLGMLEGNVFGDIKDDLGIADETTVGGYHLDTPKADHIIDFVFYTPAKVHPIHYEVVDMEVDGGYVSDHKGIYAEAALLY